MASIICCWISRGKLCPIPSKINNSAPGIPEAIYQQLEGHEGYLNGAYKRYTEEELRKYYLKGMNELLIFETTPDLTETNKEIEELKKDKEIILFLL